MAKQLQNTGRNWYAIHTYAGYEYAVERAIRQRIETYNMQDFIFDVVVPEETQIVIKKGEKKSEKKRIFPGYVLVEMNVTDESWYVVRNTPNVTGFVGSGNIPVPVSLEEFKMIKRRMGDKDNSFKIDFEMGEMVIITEGPFNTYEGTISEIDDNKGKVEVLVSMFGRETPVELDFTQIKKK
ncbi:MAG: transcription termination/antitermination protein NusG [Candidatus Gracilibacteria bacterium]